MLVTDEVTDVVVVGEVVMVVLGDVVSVVSNSLHSLSQKSVDVAEVVWLVVVADVELVVVGGGGRTKQRAWTNSWGFSHDVTPKTRLSAIKVHEDLPLQRLRSLSPTSVGPELLHGNGSESSSAHKF